MGPVGERFLMSVAQAVWLATPVILGGAVHIAVIKLDLLRSLAGLPLDGGLRFRGRRLLGDNKTVRGAVTMIGATATFVVLQAVLSTRAGWARPLSLVDFDRVHPLLWGVVLGGGYIAGELPNSFIKRQLGVAPGDRPAGVLAPLFWLTDELDGLAGVLLCMSTVWVAPLRVALLLAGVTLVVHPAMGFVMVALGLKRQIG